MKWEPAGKDAFKSSDDRFTVCRVTYVNTSGPHPLWEAWRRRTHEDGPGRLGAWVSQDEARAVCEGEK